MTDIPSLIEEARRLLKDPGTDLALSPFLMSVADDLSRIRSVYDFAKQAARIAELESVAKCDCCGKPFDDNGGVCEPCHSSTIQQHIVLLVARIRELEAERDKLAEANMDAEMAHGALNAIHELLDSGGIPRGTFADDHVRNLVAKYNNLKAAYKDREAERDTIRAKTIGECDRAIRALQPAAEGGE